MMTAIYYYAVTPMQHRNAVYWSAVFSVLIALTEFTIAAYHIVKEYSRNPDENNAATSARVHKPRQHYNFYIEFSNGTRIRQFVPIAYDDRSAQTIFLHTVLAVFALPGFVMPLLLYLAANYQHYYYYVWWICWITLQNVHSSVDFFVMTIKCLVNLRCAIINDDYEKFKLYWSSLCYFVTFAKDLFTPFTVYLSIVVLNNYREMSFNVMKDRPLLKKINGGSHNSSSYRVVNTKK